MKKLTFILALLILGCACGNVSEREINRPEHLIERKKMAEITAQAHLVETVLRMSHDPEKETPYYSVLYYNALFANYKTNASDFMESLKYYTSDFEKAQKFYNEVQEHLNTLQEERTGSSN
jgi:hypothetical protein